MGHTRLEFWGLPTVQNQFRMYCTLHIHELHVLKNHSQAIKVRVAIHPTIEIVGSLAPISVIHQLDRGHYSLTASTRIMKDVRFE